METTTRSTRLEALVRAQLRSAASAAAERGTTLDMQVSGPSQPIRADAARVCEAVAYVLQTAVSHCAAGGRVSIRLEFGASEAALSASLDGDGLADESRYGVLDERLSPAREVFEDHGGTLRLVGRELIASLAYGS